VTATAVAETEQTTGPDPKREQRRMLGLFSLFAAVVAPVTVLCLMEWGVMPSEAMSKLAEWEVYRFALPILAATGLMTMFGALTFLLRRMWPAVGAVVSSFLVVVGYLAPMMDMGYSPWGFIGFTLIFLSLLMTGGLWAVNNAVAVLSPKELLNKLPVLEMLRPRTIHKVGTLRYTAFGLGMVFFWLLWGDFAYSLFDNNMPGILNLKLKDMGASDMVNVLLNKTIAYVVVFLFAPAVSFRSDRHRGRWGRRMPFLFWSTPFVGLFIFLMGCYEPLTNLVTGGAATATIMGFTLSSTAVSLIVFGILFVAYDFSNICVGTVYWYLFNDVVPERLLSQFLSCFRIVGTLAGMFYSKWIFPNILDHFQITFMVGGVIYVLAYLAMCVMVKEGNYPPPPPLPVRPTGKWERVTRYVALAPAGRWADNFMAQAKTYAKECFTHRFYWYFFLQSMFFFVSWQTGIFSTIRNRDSLGLTLQQLGDLGAITMFVSLLLQYPAGWLADKWNPIRVFTLTTFITFGQNICQCLFIFFPDLTPKTNLLIMYWLSFTLMPFSVLHGAAEIPMYMRLLPKERYGQFCSANAMIRSFALIFGSILAGYFMDSLATHFHMDDFRYRFYPVWAVAFQIPAFIFLGLLYREWKRRGGDKGYTPPEAGVPSGGDAVIAAPAPRH
jgi:Na+/melibiose symporter-like transporter